MPYSGVKILGARMNEAHMESQNPVHAGIQFSETTMADPGSSDFSDSPSVYQG